MIPVVFESFEATMTSNLVRSRAAQLEETVNM
jgi:hypothetical protein